MKNREEFNIYNERGRGKKREKGKKKRNEWKKGGKREEKKGIVVKRGKIFLVCFLIKFRPLSPP